MIFVWLLSAAITLLVGFVVGYQYRLLEEARERGGYIEAFFPEASPEVWDKVLERPRPADQHRRTAMSRFYQPLTFTCGACGTTVTNLLSYIYVETIMRAHAEVCPGYPPVATVEPDAYEGTTSNPVPVAT